MPNLRLLSRDPLSGDETHFYYDESAEMCYVTETANEANMRAIIDANKEDQKNSDGYNKGRDNRFAARVPPWILEKWKHEYGLDWTNKNHMPGIKRLLNSSEWRDLRVANFNL